MQAGCLPMWGMPGLGEGTKTGIEDSFPLLPAGQRLTVGRVEQLAWLHVGETALGTDLPAADQTKAWQWGARLGCVWCSANMGRCPAQGGGRRQPQDGGAPSPTPWGDSRRLGACAGQPVKMLLAWLGSAVVGRLGGALEHLNYLDQFRYLSAFPS